MQIASKLTPGLRGLNVRELKWAISSGTDDGQQKSRGWTSLLPVYVVMHTPGGLVVAQWGHSSGDGPVSSTTSSQTAVSDSETSSRLELLRPQSLPPK